MTKSVTLEVNRALEEVSTREGLLTALSFHQKRCQVSIKQVSPGKAAVRNKVSNRARGIVGGYKLKTGSSPLAQLAPLNW